ncbi:MAG: hypothetical protein PGN09_09130 [Sphingomonas fennica]
MIEADLVETLRQLAPPLAALHAPWWLIGSAAMALHGAAPIVVADVDLLVSPGDAAALIGMLGLVPLRAGSDRFRSNPFARWTAPPLPVEIMADFHVRAGDGWVPVRPATRQAVTIGGSELFVPSVAELRAIGRLYGRPKDAERDRLLAAIEPTNR